MVAARHIRAFQIMGQLWLFPSALFIAVPAAECSFVVSPASNNPPCWKYRQLYALLLWGPLDTTRERALDSQGPCLCLYIQQGDRRWENIFIHSLVRAWSYLQRAFLLYKKKGGPIDGAVWGCKKNSIEKAHPEERDTWPNSHIFLRH